MPFVRMHISVNTLACVGLVNPVYIVQVPGEARRTYLSTGNPQCHLSGVWEGSAGLLLMCLPL